MKKPRYDEQTLDAMADYFYIGVVLGFTVQEIAHSIKRVMSRQNERKIKETSLRRQLYRTGLTKKKIFSVAHVDRETSLFARTMELVYGSSF